MITSEPTIERIRVSILRMLNAAHPMRMRTGDVHQELGMAGMVVDQDLVISQMESLKEAGFVTGERDAINKTVWRWTRTEEGRVYLAERRMNF